MEIASRSKTALRAGVAVVALAATAGTAFAGGFAVREQSASLMGSAFAGAAAGVDLSSSFWNPAAFGIAQDGLSTQSAYTMIIGDTELSNMSTSPVNIGGPTSTDIDKIGLLSSSYGAYRINDKLVLGVAMTAPFGLATDSDNYRNRGRAHGVAADMMTINLATSLAYEIAPGIHVAAGPQFEFMKLKYWLGSAGAPGNTTALKLQDDIGIGFSAGVMMKNATTSVGLGFRSKIIHEMDGDGYRLPGLGTGVISANLDTPEMVTLSFVHALSNQMRAMGTVEWTNWSRLTDVPINVNTPLGVAQLGVLEAGWHDGWFISGGMEYDYSPVVTLRGGVAWEKSPIQNPSERLSLLPDSDRIWLSMGATYKYSESTTLDFSYAHVFFEDSHLTRDTVNKAGLILDADVENSANIISVGMRHKW